MKKSLKKIFSLLTVALILVSTLPIGASAAYSKSLTVNFGFDCTIYDSIVDDPAAVKSAMKSLIFEFFDQNENDRTYDYNGSSFSTTVVDSDYENWDIRITNPSFYEFQFDLRVPDTGTTFGIFKIPAATYDSNGNIVPGVYKLDLSTVFSQNPNAAKLSFWVRASYPPTYISPYNESYSLINIYTGSTLHSTQKVYADQNTVGSWSKPLYQLNRDGYINLPDQLNGYLIDMQEYGLMTITVDPDKVNTYNVYYDLKINSSYSILYAETPKGKKEIAKIYAPSNHVGSYTVLLQYLNNEGMFPTVVDGYQFVPSLSPDYIVVDSDKVNEYTLSYVDLAADKKIVIYYYDQDGKLIKPMTYYVNSMASDFSVPQLSPYVSIPYKLDLIEGVMTETFNVFCIDFTSSYDAAYQKGYDEGISIKQDELNTRLEEAYDRGKEDGLSQNTLLINQKKQLMRDYNVFTAFFDGIFTGLLSATSYLFDGISFGGITLGGVFSALTVAIVVGFIVKRLF